jgi:twinkle protein
VEGGEVNVVSFMEHQRITDADLAAYRDSPDPGRNITTVLAYHLDVARMLNGLDDQGDVLPWKKTQGDFKLRPGEVTLWHGINGHGKSAVTSQVALWLALRGKNCCLASFEMLPKYTLMRMVKQAAGNGAPTEEFVSQFFLGLASRMWIYDRQGRVDPEYLFAAMRYCAAEKGVRHFFVDSLMKCVPKEDDYAAQVNFVNSLDCVARETGMHVHLIHHVRKGENEDRPPTKFDAKGSGGITDQVSNVIAVWRNKKKERENQALLELGQALTEESPDFLLICDKQRNGMWEGMWALWGDRTSWHFRESVREPWSRGYEMPEPPKLRKESNDPR